MKGIVIIMKNKFKLIFNITTYTIALICNVALVSFLVYSFLERMNMSKAISNNVFIILMILGELYMLRKILIVDSGHANFTNFKKFIDIKNFKLKNFILCVIFSMTFIIIECSFRIFIEQYVDLNYIRLNFYYDKTTIIRYIFAILIAPVFEEIVFRKLLQGRLETVITAYSAIIIQSIIFSCLHLNNLFFSFIFAVFLTLISKWSGCLTLSIICHVVNNLISSFFVRKFYIIANIPIIVLITLVIFIITIFIMFKNRIYDFKEANNLLYKSKCIK